MFIAILKLAIISKGRPFHHLARHFKGRGARQVLKTQLFCLHIYSNPKEEHGSVANILIQRRVCQPQICGFVG